MLNLREVHKPKTIDEALELLKQPDTVALAGGTELLARKRREVRAVVDLSALGLTYIRDQDGALAIGATTTLADVAESPILRAVANGVIAQAAHRSASSILRNQGTVAGTLIAEPAGIFAVALAALGATLTLPSPSKGEGKVALPDFLAHRAGILTGALVTQVVIPAAALNRRGVIETVARTPRDKPIVAVCAAFEMENDAVRTAGIALGGVGATAVRATRAEEMLTGKALNDATISAAARAAMEGLNPPSDHRGSAEYRREMVRVLVRRMCQRMVK